MSTIKGYYQSPLGLLKIEASEIALVAVSFLHEETISMANGQEGSAIVENTKVQLTEYFEGKRKQFDLPLNYSGTEFQQKVWEALTCIPFGKTMSYGQLASLLGAKELVRAVGNANRKNPIGIIVPCHRIIGSQGSLVGYAGGLWRKQWLLEHESSQQLLPWQ